MWAFVIEQCIKSTRHSTITSTIKMPKKVPSSCQSCQRPKRDDEKFKVCSRCKLQCYCSKECQAADWEYHKLLCGGASSHSRGLERWINRNLTLLKGSLVSMLSQDVFHSLLIVNVRRDKKSFVVDSVRASTVEKERVTWKASLREIFDVYKLKPEKSASSVGWRVGTCIIEWAGDCRIWGICAEALPQPILPTEKLALLLNECEKTYTASKRKGASRSKAVTCEK